MKACCQNIKGGKRGNRRKTMEVLNVPGEWIKDCRAKGMVKWGLEVRRWGKDGNEGRKGALEKEPKM